MNIHDALDLIIVTADTDWVDGPTDLYQAAEALSRLRDALPSLHDLECAAEVLDAYNRANCENYNAQQVAISDLHTALSDA